MVLPKGGAKKTLVNQVFENTGIILKAYIRGESARSMYMSGNVDINYIPQGENKAIYFVGEIGAGMKDVLEKTCSFKEVSAVGESKLIFDQILKLMAVGFVKFGMLIVIPFLFKYLREYALTEQV